MHFSLGSARQDTGALGTPEALTTNIPARLNYSTLGQRGAKAISIAKGVRVVGKKWLSDSTVVLCRDLYVLVMDTTSSLPA